MNDNLKFWESVEGTDPTMTKSVKVSGQNRTSVDAQYKKKMITKAFGMYGMAWGVLANSESYERTSYPNDTTILHYRATAFYVKSDKQCTFPIAASIKESYVTNNGQGYLKIDDEAVKKVRTDTLTKGFTDLGFCSDIHMGMFDDDAYIIAQTAKTELEKQGHTEEALNKAIDEIKTWVNREIEQCKKLLPKSEAGFKAAMKKVRKDLITRCQAVRIHPAKYTNRLDEIAIEQLANLEKSKTEQNNAS